MPRVTPGQVVELIDKLFPHARDENEGNIKDYLTRENCVQVAAILELIKQVPPELIVVNASQYAEYISSIAALRDLIEQWRAQDFAFHYVRGLRRYGPISLIRQALAMCPSEIPAATTPSLRFIRDRQLREGLRLDISSVNTSLSNGEWKAATVLAGSAVEALLLWSIHKSTAPARGAAIARAVSKGLLSKGPGSNLLRWDLNDFVEVAFELGLITADTAQQTRLARDYRNLIHPGKEQRKGIKCDNATALTAVAALAHVVRDLS